jgi:hypothetical protein
MVGTVKPQKEIQYSACALHARKVRLHTPTHTETEISNIASTRQHLFRERALCYVIRTLSLSLSQYMFIVFG